MAQPGQRISEYVLIERVGAGTFGEVWRAAHHVWAQQVVAIKLPNDPEYLRALQREGLNLRSLDHPNIVKAIGFDPYATPPYLVMEYVAGESLRAWIKRGKMPVEQTLAILRQVLTGLIYANERGILHRDLKPENIMVDGRAVAEGFRDGYVKLTDFGSGLRLTSSAESIAWTMSVDSANSQMAGTLDYMAPEQKSGAAPGAQSDLYSAGVVLFELLTGERPAGTEVPSDLVPTVPKWLDEVFRHAYARSDRRFATASDFLKSLDGPGAPPLPSTSQVLPLNTCPRCRRSVEPGDQFCMHCGVQLTNFVRRCSKCGGYPGPEDHYCLFCGAVLPAQRVVTTR